jgi:hypothetical protein
MSDAAAESGFKYYLRHDFWRLFRSVTFDIGDDGFPVWSPDGRQIVFSSNRSGVTNLYIKGSTDGALAEEYKGLRKHVQKALEREFRLGLR